MKKWKTVIDLEKYYGEKTYKEKQKQLEKKEYTKEEKIKMSMEMTNIIREKQFTLYHDFMEYLSVNCPDMFNMLTFDKKENKFILEYIKSKAASRYR